MLQLQFLILGSHYAAGNVGEKLNRESKASFRPLFPSLEEQWSHCYDFLCLYLFVIWFFLFYTVAFVWS